MYLLKVNFYTECLLAFYNKVSLWLCIYPKQTKPISISSKIFMLAKREIVFFFSPVFVWLNYWQFAEVINSFISSSLGSSIMYFCTKMFGSNPAVAYFTNVSPFSVQSKIPIGGLSSGCITSALKWLRYILSCEAYSWRNLSIFNSTITWHFKMR